MNGMHFILLIIFSAFTMNLTLQCALGIRGIAESRIYNGFSTMVKLGIILFSIILMWILFSKIISTFISGFFIYALLFPVSYIVYDSLEFVVFQQILKKDPKEKCFVSFPGGITAVAVFICLNIAINFLEAILLSFGFTAGILIVYFIIREIGKRAALEAVPRFLRGIPLLIIVMGLLSLIFSFASLMILRMISAG
ncbi:MAG: hypothetical protein LBU88_02545 [Treponema sp.]|jgi:electron transport complex protein RnfA|nr:hypothetical protein [Treponema sp.]